MMLLYASCAAATTTLSLQTFHNHVFALSFTCLHLMHERVREAKAAPLYLSTSFARSGLLCQSDMMGAQNVMMIPAQIDRYQRYIYWLTE